MCHSYIAVTNLNLYGWCRTHNFIAAGKSNNRIISCSKIKRELRLSKTHTAENTARLHLLFRHSEKILPEIKTAETDNPEEFLHRLNRFRINAKTQTLRLSSSFPKSLSDFSWVMFRRWYRLRRTTLLQRARSVFQNIRKAHVKPPENDFCLLSWLCYL